MKYNIPRSIELKGSTTRPDIKIDLLKKIAKLPLEIHAITVKKENVWPRLQTEQTSSIII